MSQAFAARKTTLPFILLDSLAQICYKSLPDLPR
jgi:hypothetical protein